VNLFCQSLQRIYTADAGSNFRQLHTDEVIFLHGCDVLQLDKKRTISFLPHSFYGREKTILPFYQ
jgi:hypothetical protein